MYSDFRTWKSLSLHYFWNLQMPRLDHRIFGSVPSSLRSLLTSPLLNFQKRSFLRYTGRNLKFHVLLLADALPCTWEIQSSFLGGRMDAQWLTTFRSETIFFDPCVQTTFVSSESVSTVGKRVRALSFASQSGFRQAQTRHTRWQTQLLPPFEASPRLVIDFDAGGSFKVQGLVQVLAHRMGAKVLGPSVKSYASTKQSRRKCFHLHLDGSLPQSHAQSCIDQFRGDILAHGVQHVAIGM